MTVRRNGYGSQRAKGNVMTFPQALHLDWPVDQRDRPFPLVKQYLAVETFLKGNAMTVFNSYRMKGNEMTVMSGKRWSKRDEGF